MIPHRLPNRRRQLLLASVLLLLGGVLLLARASAAGPESAASARSWREGIPQGDGAALAMLRDQLLLAWKTHPGTLIQVLARRDRDLDITRGLLEFNDPAALQEMEAWLEKLR